MVKTQSHKPFYLIGLTLPSDGNRIIEELRTRLFREHKLISARTWPAMIPIAYLNGPLPKPLRVFSQAPLPVKAGELTLFSGSLFLKAAHFNNPENPSFGYLCPSEFKPHVIPASDNAPIPLFSGIYLADMPSDNRTRTIQKFMESHEPTSLQWKKSRLSLFELSTPGTDDPLLYQWQQLWQVPFRLQKKREQK